MPPARGRVTWRLTPTRRTNPRIVERWLEDQQQWQRTVLAYLDSMTKNDDFLVHLGNAMRGSLLAGKPYPTRRRRPPAGPAAGRGAGLTTDWTRCSSRCTSCRVRSRTCT